MTQHKHIDDPVREEIQSLAQAITEVVTNFRGIRPQLRESKAKVPIATDQLDRISEQTEAVTHQMLDKIESILAREEDVVNGLNQIKVCVRQGQTETISDLADELVEKANTTLSDTYEIMHALQFQDITAQQVNHAAAQLEELERRLSRISTALAGQSNPESADASNDGASERAFDATANFTDRRADQAAVDDLVSRQQADDR